MANDPDRSSHRSVHRIANVAPFLWLIEHKARLALALLLRRPALMALARSSWPELAFPPPVCCLLFGSPG